MRQILADHRIQLTRSLGQSFLHDGNQLRRIIEAAELAKTDRALEIGPGLGPLTQLLLECAGEVLAIETDLRLVRVLQERFQLQMASVTPALRILHDDALDYLCREERDWSGWKLVANLPYSVASPILVELAQATRPPGRLVVTLQLEVARRLLAGPSTPDYGVLTLLVQAAYQPLGSFKIPRTCFFPEPDVDSACATLVRRVEPLLEPNAVPVFAEVVKRAFSQRRKMMLKLLKSDWPAADLASIFEELRIPLQARAENVTLEQFVRLTQCLSRDSRHG